MTVDVVGVNGIDPVRQGFTFYTLNSNDRGFGVMVESLANRANAIRPYEIYRHRSQSKQTVIRVILFLEIT